MAADQPLIITQIHGMLQYSLSRDGVQVEMTCRDGVYGRELVPRVGA